MAKVKTVFICRNCGTESAKWIGRCPSCNQWNTYIEEKVIPASKDTVHQRFSDVTSVPTPIGNIEAKKISRISSTISEFDRLLGGGIVPGSLILLGGEPGIGKSTLALQFALGMKSKVLYVSGEESLEQLSMRADRLAAHNPQCLVYNEVDLESILNQVENLKPNLIVIDSIQTLQTASIDASPGSLTQIRECAARLLKLSKITQIPVILIGHITKDGVLAGPKILEHIVDVVLQFEGDQHYAYRILRSLKNRFGSTSELAIFGMEADGLHEIKNPSELFISRNSDPFSGVAISSTIDGTRPLLIEAQALVSSAVYGTPQRASTGFDVRRLNMLLAVLERKAGFNLGAKDVFLNIAGGYKVQDTATDLGVAMAILSSAFDKPVGSDTCLTAEISLTGELKPVMKIEQRIEEARRLGFKKIIIPVYPKKNQIPTPYQNVKVIPVGRIEQAISLIFSSRD